MPANVLGLCEGGELEVQMFKLAPNFNRSTMLKFSTNAPTFAKPQLGVCACLSFG